MDAWLEDASVGASPFEAVWARPSAPAVVPGAEDPRYGDPLRVADWARLQRRAADARAVAYQDDQARQARRRRAVLVVASVMVVGGIGSKLLGFW